MPKINVYLPDELAAAVRDAQVPVSAICQAALERAVRDVSAMRGSDLLPLEPPAHGPFKRFTPRAQKAMALGQQRAVAHRHTYVGTEHVMLGIIDEGGNMALRVLTSLDVEPEDLRRELEGSLGPASGPVDSAPPFTPLAKKALELSTKEAQGLGHNYVGCEHLLLGVLAAENGLGGQVLQRLGVELRTTRRAVVSALAGFVHPRAQLEDPPQASVTSTLDDILARLEAIERRLAS
jgi:ATP-dependent Clp protease ATP-binding subunit ClpC